LPNKKEKGKMKTKIIALLLSLIMVLSIPLFVFSPKASADQLPGLAVCPTPVVFEAPCQISKTFTITVTLYVPPTLSVYAFDFQVDWFNSTYGQPSAVAGIPYGTPTGGNILDYANSMISLVSAKLSSPWKNYFVVANQTYSMATRSVYQPSTWWNGWFEYENGYHLAITALDTSPPLNNTLVTVLTLTFHIDDEPSPPNTWETPFIFCNVQLSDKNGAPVNGGQYELDSGLYEIEAPYFQDVHLMPDAPLDSPYGGGHAYFVESQVGQTVEVDVWMSNMSRCFGFDFYLYYNACLLTPNEQAFDISPLFPPPYENLVEYVSYDWGIYNSANGMAYIYVCVQRPLTKPTVCSKNTEVFSIIFTTSYNPDISGYLIPWDAIYITPTKSTGNDVISITDANQFSYVETVDTYVLTPVIYPCTSYVNTSIDYFWRPAPGDLDLTWTNGYPVTVDDLSALASVYGVNLPAYDSAITGLPVSEFLGLTWGDLAPASPAPGVVNIYDFVIVAKHYEKPFTPTLAN
jgi:hypothetical protein